MKAFFYLLFIITFYACSNSKDSALEYTLAKSRENRVELEAVLNHYSSNPKDSLKYRAARYLIENMPSHYTYVMNEDLVRYHDHIEMMMDSLKNEPLHIKDSVYRKILKSYNHLVFEKVKDIHVITSRFLIDNIEHSFKVWNDHQWAQHLSFDEFCEYILPYKVFEGQLLDNWKEFFYDRYNKLLSNLPYSSLYSKSSYMACEILNQALYHELRPSLNSELHEPILRLKTLLSIPSGPCDEYSIIATAVMRANGIPTGMDFTPQWPFRSLGHSWNFLHENTKNNISFEGASSTISVRHKKDHIMAKVFRHTYRINREIEGLIEHERDVPPLFLNLLMEDVTREYLSTIDIELKVEKKSGLVYLAVFNNRDWEILAWGKCKNGKVTFSEIGKDVLYLPVKYKNNAIEPIGNPFIVRLDNSITELKIDTAKKQTLRLTRKFPLWSNAFNMHMRKVGSKIQGSNHPEFIDSHTETFHVFTDLENNININPENKKYKYWRVLSADDGFSNVSELKFYREDNSQVAGKIIGTNGSQDGIRYKKEDAFDEDLLTFFDAPEGSGGWVGMEFDTSISITRVTCMMRGDGNDIEIGDEYELVYWKNGKWVSLGKKIAQDISLEYENCPVGTVFLLHNKTKGKEERIFTYENGKQIWW